MINALETKMRYYTSKNGLVIPGAGILVDKVYNGTRTKCNLFLFHSIHRQNQYQFLRLFVAFFFSEILYKISSRY